MDINFEEIYNGIFHYLQVNAYITIALAACMLYVLFRKPKAFFVLLLILTVLSAAFYVISQISSAGLETKDEMIKVKTLPH